jgi:hypothetical protein
MRASAVTGEFAGESSPGAAQGTLDVRAPKRLAPLVGDPLRSTSMACRELLSACLAGAAASLGCSALLDLDVQYQDAGLESGTLPPDRTSDGAGSAHDASREALPEANRASPEAASRDDAGNAETSPGVPDDSSHVPNDSSPDVPNDSPPAPRIQYVQSISSSNNYVGAVVHVTFVNPVTLNDTIVVAANEMTTGAPNVSDSLGNQFSSTPGVPNGGSESWIFYAPMVTPGMDTITVSLPGNPSGTLLDVYALEYSGVGALDAVTGQNGTTSDMHSGFVTTTAPGDLIFGFAVVVPMGSADAGLGFRARETQHDNVTEDEILPGPGRVEATATMTGGNAWTTMVAAFKAR